MKMGDEPVAPHDGVASLVGSEAAFAVINEAGVLKRLRPKVLGRHREAWFHVLAGDGDAADLAAAPGCWKPGARPSMRHASSMAVFVRWHAGFVRPPHRSRTVHRPPEVGLCAASDGLESLCYHVACRCPGSIHANAAAGACRPPK